MQNTSTHQSNRVQSLNSRSKYKLINSNGAIDWSFMHFHDRRMATLREIVKTNFQHLMGFPKSWSVVLDFNWRDCGTATGKRSNVGHDPRSSNSIYSNQLTTGQRPFSAVLIDRSIVFVYSQVTSHKRAMRRNVQDYCSHMHRKTTHSKVIFVQRHFRIVYLLVLVTFAENNNKILSSYLCGRRAYNAYIVAVY